MIKPSQIPTDLQRIELDEAEKVLDAYLLKHYKHKRLYIGNPTKLNRDLYFVLLDKYKAAGWVVQYDTDTVDGIPSGPYFSEE